MNDRRLDLGFADSAHVESFGEPGQRTFRIRIDIPSGTISLWMEKYQVVLLGSAIEELLEQAPEDVVGEYAGAPSSFVGDLDVRIGSLALGFDQLDGLFHLEAGDFESAFDLETILFRVNRAGMTEMGEEVSEIVAGSRPRCVLCGTPLTGEPHFCPDQNGHAKITSD